MQNEKSRKNLLKEELEKLKEKTETLENKYTELIKNHYSVKLKYDKRMYDLIKIEDLSLEKEREIVRLKFLPIKEKKPLVPCIHNINTGDSLKVLKEFEINKLRNQNHIFKHFIKEIALQLDPNDSILVALEKLVNETKDDKFIGFVNENLFKYKK
ncbi:hypothetical protein TUBRATIS_004550 [Tubulinosema ratisbonensis]|uniref:Uncharacterized protein n=1 Tax=Tubulinosema ratisbonensis TaxID=291195 RepID=A0A437APK3_9MICR|nr:hypothetical protein TUBRATIS_004550 [Tubulinosema ratisbonensis]